MCDSPFVCGVCEEVAALFEALCTLCGRERNLDQGWSRHLGLALLEWELQFCSFCMVLVFFHRKLAGRLVGQRF